MSPDLHPNTLQCLADCSFILDTHKYVGHPRYIECTRVNILYVVLCNWRNWSGVSERLIFICAFVIMYLLRVGMKAYVSEKNM